MKIATVKKLIYKTDATETKEKGTMLTDTKVSSDILTANKLPALAKDEHILITPDTDAKGWRMISETADSMTIEILEA